MDSSLVVLATMSGDTDRDGDLDAMVAAVRSRGADCRAVAWDDPDFDWSRAALVVVRSTWDYWRRLDEYLGWVRRVAQATRLANPAEVIEWNTDKHYLGELAAAGVPVVPTVFAEPGRAPAFPDAEEIVVKPAVSAGARDSARYRRSQRGLAEAHVRMIHDIGRTALIQPYLRRIADGERALIYLDGAFSHAVRKGPVITEPGVIDNDRVAHPDPVDHVPSREEFATAERALAACPGSGGLLYARVDLALDDAGRPVVMELELVEPDLFCARSQAALRNFAAAVERWLPGRRTGPAAADAVRA